MTFDALAVSVVCCYPDVSQSVLSANFSSVMDSSVCSRADVSGGSSLTDFYSCFDCTFRLLLIDSFLCIHSFLCIYSSAHSLTYASPSNRVYDLVWTSVCSCCVSAFLPAAGISPVSLRTLDDCHSSFNVIVCPF